MMLHPVSVLRLQGMPARVRVIALDDLDDRQTFELIQALMVAGSDQWGNPWRAQLIREVETMCGGTFSFSPA